MKIRCYFCCSPLYSTAAGTLAGGLVYRKGFMRPVVLVDGGRRLRSSIVGSGEWRGPVIVVAMSILLSLFGKRFIDEFALFTGGLLSDVQPHDPSVRFGRFSILLRT